MNLLERSIWWIVPAFLIAGFMVFAMMEFTGLLMIRRPRSSEPPLAAARLRERLLALNAPDRPFRLVVGNRSDLEVEWDVVDASWLELFAKVKLSSTYRARMLFDEERHELNWFETLRTSSWFIGFEGWKARFSGSIRWHWGTVDAIWRGLAYGILPGFPPRIGRVYAFELNTVALRDEISAVVARAGWTFRPAPHALRVSRAWRDRVRALLPARARHVRERWLWGSLYVSSFLLFYLYVLVAIPDAAAGDYTWRNLWPAAVVGAGWWATWAAIAWLLAGRSGLRKRV